MREIFVTDGEIELKNAYNITATNFIKNLIFYTKPRVVAKRLVWIKDYKSIVSLIDDFNKYFLKFEISVNESKVKVECLGELEKIEHHLEGKIRLILEVMLLRLTRSLTQN